MNVESSAIEFTNMNGAGAPIIRYGTLYKDSVAFLDEKESNDITKDKK
jgi:hypothetical protein